MGVLILNSAWDKQQKIIENLAKKVTIFLTYDSRDSLDIAKQISKKLQEFDYKIYDTNILDRKTLGLPFDPFKAARNAIDLATHDGFVFSDVINVLVRMG